MAPDSDSSSNPGDLQFDKVAVAAPAGSMVCSSCGKTIEATYYQLHDKPLCEACKNQVEAQVTAHLAQCRGAKGMMRAALFGLGAAIAGAVLYYAIIALTGLEIGLVAIVIGYMVGYSVRKGSFGVGGRRFQVLAVVLTYFAVGLAYTPLAFKGLKSKDGAEPSATSDSAAVTANTSSDSIGAGVVAKPVEAKPVPVKALLYLAAFVFVLPVLAVVGSMPSGLLSALIIGFGLMQAWKMTAGAIIAIKGPFRISAAPSPGPA